MAGQGSAVALSADGNIALVGGDVDNNSTGAVWVWTRSGGVWTQGPKLVGSGGTGFQGASVALSADGNTALIGGGINAGVWTRNNGVWTQQGPALVGSGAVGLAAQGMSVALSADGNTALVGGPFDNGNLGAVWVWTRSGGVWTQQGSKLVGTGAVPGMGNRVLQGFSVALSGDGNTALATAPSDNDNGAVWVWTRSSGLWTQQAKLAGAGGSSVAVSADGNTAIVGETTDDFGIGAVWVWTRSGGVWAEGPKLRSPLYLPSAAQGHSVALSADGNTAVVGIPELDPTYRGPGAVAVWTRSAGVWSPTRDSTRRHGDD